MLILRIPSDIRLPIHLINRYITLLVKVLTALGISFWWLRRNFVRKSELLGRSPIRKYESLLLLFKGKNAECPPIVKAKCSFLNRLT